MLIILMGLFYNIIVAFTMVFLCECNYDPVFVDKFSSIMIPIQMASVTGVLPLYQKYSLNKSQTIFPTQFSATGMRPIDTILLHDANAPLQVLFLNIPAAFALLQPTPFILFLRNPSTIFTICIQALYIDSNHAHETNPRKPPFCLQPIRKFAFQFSLYSLEEQLHSCGIYLKVSLWAEQRKITQKVWVREFIPNKIPNYLRLQQIISYDEDYKNQITVLLKTNIPLQLQFDGNVSVMHKGVFITKLSLSSNQNVIVHGRGSWIIRSMNHLPLVVPVLQKQGFYIQSTHIGHLPKQKSALTYPILSTNKHVVRVELEGITVSSTSKSVTVNLQHQYVPATQQFFRLGSFTVRASILQGCHSINITVRYKINGHLATASLHIVYEQSDLIDIEWESKKFVYSYVIKNNLEVPVKIRHVIYQHYEFELHMSSENQYIPPGRSKHSFTLKYIGSTLLMQSPSYKQVTLLFSGGLVKTFLLALYDNTLNCQFNNSLQRIPLSKCSTLPIMTFRYHTDNSVNQTIFFANTHQITQIVGVRVSKDSKITPKLQFSTPASTQHTDPSETYLSTVLNAGEQSSLTLIFKPCNCNFTLQMLTLHEKFKVNIKVLVIEGQLKVKGTQIVFMDQESSGFIQIFSTYPQVYSITHIEVNTSTFKVYFDPKDKYQSDKWISLQFKYTPQNNTAYCCQQQFLLHRFLSQHIEINIIISSGLHKKIIVNVGMNHSSLITSAKQIKILRIPNNSIEITLHNPYAFPMKYKLLMLNAAYSQSLITHSYFTKKKKAIAYFCVPDEKLYFVSLLGELFQLTNCPFSSKLSSNSYVKALQSLHASNCFKFNTTVYIKNLIQTKVINNLLQNHTQNIVLTFLKKEIDTKDYKIHLQYDQFYLLICLNLTEMCCRPDLSIFRFCRYSQINISTVQQVIQSGVSRKINLTTNSNKKLIQYQLAIINNYSIINKHFGIVTLVDSKISLEINNTRVSQIQMFIQQNVQQRIQLKICNQAQLDLFFNNVSLTNNVCQSLGFVLQNCSSLKNFKIQKYSSIDIYLKWNGKEVSKLIQNKKSIFLQHDQYFIQIPIMVNAPQFQKTETMNQKYFQNFKDILFILTSILLSFWIMWVCINEQRTYNIKYHIKIIKQQHQFDKCINLQQRLLKKAIITTKTIKNITNSTFSSSIKLNPICTINENQLLFYRIKEQQRGVVKQQILSEESIITHKQSLQMSEQKIIQLHAVEAQLFQKKLQINSQLQQIDEQFLSQGIKVPQQILQQFQKYDFGFGEQKNEIKQYKKQQYFYNVFYSVNPLKKENPFPFLKN